MMALLEDYKAVCKVWLQRPRFRVLYDFLEPFPQLVADGEEEAQDGDPNWWPSLPEPATGTTMADAGSGHGALLHNGH